VTNYTYQAFVFEQRVDGGGPQLALFVAPAGEVSAWAAVERLSEKNRLGPQREPNKSRINSIRRFFADDKDNTIPTAIVIALRGIKIEDGGGSSKLKLKATKEEPLPGLIIDGQHRLRGLEAVDPQTMVPIVGIIEPTDLEMAFQFLVINNKSAKVPRDHLRALALNYSAEQLETRLRTARLALDANLGSVGVLDEDPDSPFRGIVSWPNNPPGNRIVVPAAIEAMASEAKSLGFGELEDLDSLNAFLIAMWSVIKEEWAHLFVAESKLLSKVGLTCTTKFICSTMKTWARNPRMRDLVDPGDPEKVRTVTKEVLATLDPSFFEADWASTSYDTRAGRDMVMADLETLSFNVANGEPWHEGLKVVSRGWIQDLLAAPSGATILPDSE
jgi:DGQHR domain-containing protein